MEPEKVMTEMQVGVHDAWFRKQVSLAVQEANDPRAEWVSQTEVKRESAVRRATWLTESSTFKTGAD
jgi:hypothetical protein